MDRSKWTQAVEATLGHTIDELDYRPTTGTRQSVLSTDSVPSSRGMTTQKGWQIGGSYGGTPETMRSRIDHDTAFGLDALRIDTRLIRGAKDFATTLGSVDPTETSLQLAFGSVGSLASVVGLFIGLQRPTQGLRIEAGIDPIGELGRTGLVVGDTQRHLDAAAEAAGWVGRNMPLTRVFVSDDSVWHDRGADEAWSIALAVANGMEQLRAMESAGVERQAAFNQLILRQTLPGRFLLGIAKLRATRRILHRIASLSKVTANVPQHATPAWREHTRRDRPVNVLRHTASAFAAIAGGAQRIDLPPHDEDDDAGRRLAINTQHILRDESHLGRVADPTGGSYAIEQLTDSLAREAWAHLQTLEARGGLLAAVTSGFVAEMLTASSDSLRRAVAVGSHPILGVTRFPNLGETPPDRPLDDEAPTAVPGGLPEARGFDELLTHALHASSSQMTHARVGDALSRAPFVKARRLAHPFESLRNRGDREARTLPIVTIGSLRETKARTAYGVELLASGGLNVAVDDALTTPDEGLDHFLAHPGSLAIVSCGENRMATEGDEIVRLLAAADAKIWMLGKPKDPAPWVELGVQGFLHHGIDRLDTIRTLWEQV